MINRYSTTSVITTFLKYFILVFYALELKFYFQRYYYTTFKEVCLALLQLLKVQKNMVLLL